MASGDASATAGVTARGGQGPAIQGQWNPKKNVNANDLAGMSASDLADYFKGASQDQIDQYKHQIQEGLQSAAGPLLSSNDIQSQLSKIQTAFDQSKAYNNQQDLNYQAQQQATKQSIYAQGLQDQANKFRANLPNYTGDQINNAQNVSKRNLNTDQQQVKNDASARGLLYSGVKAGNDASAAGYESGQLGSQIQSINKNANEQANAQDNLAAQASAGADAATIGVQQNTINQNETAYQQALQQQQTQNNFWTSLMGGIGAITGTATGLLKGV